ncbi:hypothetical protein SORBI_3002G143450 [Sorghum bicolor]|uniref:CCHC-type domain-containing protein n=1 Tax=Sorghum bicolor TaxID=4558 RepID=A0A1W0W3X8_SORBI|nr:hypothetical protein SORBI_3002G143450 [Sorghum bicolor]
MAAYGLDVECPHSFDGTHFARWRNWMQCNFMFIYPQMWWMVDVDIQATNIMYRSLDDCIFGEIIDMKTAHEIWVFLNEKYGAISDDDDDMPKVEAHEDVEHDHNTVVVEDCSTSWSSDDDDRSTRSSLDKIDDDATSDTNDDTTQCTLDGEGDGSCSSHDYNAPTSPSTTPHSFMSQGDTKVYNANVVNHVVSYDELVKQQKHLLYVITCSHEELKLTHEELCVTHDNLSSSLGSNDQSHIVTNRCDVGKKHVSTSCDDLLSMPCSSQLDICSTSISCETNLLKENNKLNEQVKILSNKLERCYYSKVTFEHILKTQRNYGDKCGLGFNEKMTKGKIKQEKRKLSHFMCYRCHEVGHLANGCPNKKKPQVQVKINHHGDDLIMKKKKTRRGGRARHPIQIQDAKMMSKNEDKKKAYAHIKCPTKLEKKAQAILKRQGNEKQHMSKEEKAQSKRSCYLCRERGHMAHSCPLGNNSKPISIDDNTMLRKDGNDTSMVAIAKHPAILTKASPKYVAPNLRGPKLVWVPSKSGRL